MYPTLIDMHMHTTASDGTDSPEEILKAVKYADHDAVKSCVKMQTLLSEKDPVFINGIEFSCKDGGGKYHILGFG